MRRRCVANLLIKNVTLLQTTIRFNDVHQVHRTELVNQWIYQVTDYGIGICFRYAKQI